MSWGTNCLGECPRGNVRGGMSYTRGLLFVFVGRQYVCASRGTCRSASRRRFTHACSLQSVRVGTAARRLVSQWRWIKTVVLSRLRGTVVAAGSAIVGRSATASSGRGEPSRPGRSGPGVNLPDSARSAVSAAIQLVLYVRVRVGPPGHAARRRVVDRSTDWKPAEAGGVGRRPDGDIVSAGVARKSLSRVLSRRSNCITRPRLEDVGHV